MKCPVYIESTMELIGVVDVDPEQERVLRQQRYMRMHKWESLPRFDLNTAMMPVDDSHVNVVEFSYIRFGNSNGTSTICLTVKKRGDLDVWRPVLWPRKRKERRRYRRHRLPYNSTIGIPNV